MVMMTMIVIIIDSYIAIATMSCHLVKFLSLYTEIMNFPGIVIRIRVKLIDFFYFICYFRFAEWIFIFCTKVKS